MPPMRPRLVRRAIRTDGILDPRELCALWFPAGNSIAGNCARVQLCGEYDMTTNEVPTESEPEAEVEKFTLDSIDRRYYGPESVADASEYVSNCVEVCEAAGVPVFWNFNPEPDEETGEVEPLPDGYGIAVAPIQQRSGQGSMNVIGLVVATAPSYDAVALDEKGNIFIQDLVQDVIVGKLIAAARPKPNETLGQTPFTLPVSIADFIESRRGESLKSYTEIAPAFVGALKKMGMKYINATMLRQCLQSTEFAAQQFPKIDQTSWLVAIDNMRGQAVAKKLDPAIYDHWKESRDSAGMAEIDDDTILGALAGLVEQPIEPVAVEAETVQQPTEEMEAVETAMETEETEEQPTV